ncbi:MAG: hypothetical protein POELPBGB_02179 [Bacteroidia bacterium]|nr:hypothetical protein [Bacteroidia bacterium]
MKKPIRIKTPLPRISAAVRDWAKYKRTSLRKLSKKMGKEESYLHQALRSNDVKVSLLLALSPLLNQNLFEYYTTLLPEDLQATEREKLLHKKIESLETKLEKIKDELEKVKQERDKYWEKIGR